MTDAGPLFVVGCPRSGTTVLQQLLGRHPELAVAPETHFMRRFYEQRQKYQPLSGDAGWSALTRDIAATPECAEMDVTPDELQARLAAGPRSLAAALGGWLACFAAHQQVRLVGEKTPHHAFFVPTLAQWFPGAVFVAITRDPRAVTLSTRDVWWSGGTLRRDARIWRDYSRALRRAARNVDVHDVSYEQLIVDPDAALGGVFAAAGLERPADLDAGAGGAGVALNVGREPWKANAAGPLTTSSLDRWRTTLTASEIREIEEVSWGEMRRRGYRPQTPLKQLAAGVLKEDARLVARTVIEWIRARRSR